MYMLVFLILVLSLVLRLVNINQSLWLDEAIGAIAVRDFSYTGIVTEFMRFDNHPPLYYLVLKLWTDIFGYSELSLRLPSVIFGVGTVALVYLIAKRMVAKSVILYPILSAIFLATSPFHIYYSQEARMYSLSAFLVSLVFYLFLKLTNEDKYINWFYFALSVVLLAFSDYVPVFVFPVFWIMALGVNKKGWRIKFLLSHIPLLILGALWVPTFIHQSGRGAWLLFTLPAWGGLAGGATLKQALLIISKFVLGRISFSNKTMYYILIFLASIPFGYLFFKSFQKIKNIRYVFLWFIAPLILGFVASFKTPIFIYFRFLYVVPAFYLIIAWGVLGISNSHLKKAPIVLILTVNLLGLAIYYFDKNQQREEWRQSVKFVEEIVKENEVIVFNYPEPFAPYKWYKESDNVAFGATDSISADGEKTSLKTQNIVSKKDGVYYFEYLDDITDPESIVIDSLKNEGFKVKEVYNFRGVGQVFYYKKI